MSVKEPVAVSPRIERGWRRVTRVGAAALTVSVFTVGVATVISVPAAAGLTSTTTNPTSTFSGATYWKCTSAVLAGSPFLFYPLNESNGTTAVDGSGNGRNGTYRGGVSLGATDACPRDSGTAVTFNGTTNYLSTPSLVAAPDTFTLSTWFKTTTVRGGRIIGFGDSSTGASTAADRHIYMTNAGKLVFGVKPSSTMTITSSNPYNDGAWHQVSATLSTGGMRLYVDGSLVASDAATTSGHAMNGYWRISYDSLTGWPNVPTSAYFAGTLDNVAIYTTALTATSINAGYEAGR